MAIAVSQSIAAIPLMTMWAAIDRIRLRRIIMRTTFLVAFPIVKLYQRFIFGSAIVLSLLVCAAALDDWTHPSPLVRLLRWLTVLSLWITLALNFQMVRSQEKRQRQEEAELLKLMLDRD
jgi:hypothetical protein